MPSGLLSVELSDPPAVGGVLESLHGPMKVEEEAGEEPSPHVSEVVIRSQSSAEGRVNGVVVAGVVPDDAEKIGHRAALIPPPLALCDVGLEDRTQLVDPGSACHRCIILVFHRPPVERLLELENFASGGEEVYHFLRGPKGWISDELVCGSSGRLLVLELEEQSLLGEGHFS